MLMSVNGRYILIHISKISNKKFTSNSGPHVISSHPADEAGDDYQYTNGNTEVEDYKRYDEHFGMISHVNSIYIDNSKTTCWYIE